MGGGVLVSLGNQRLWSRCQLATPPPSTPPTPLTPPPPALTHVLRTPLSVLALSLSSLRGRGGGPVGCAAGLRGGGGGGRECGGTAVWARVCGGPLAPARRSLTAAPARRNGAALLGSPRRPGPVQAVEPPAPSRPAPTLRDWLIRPMLAVTAFVYDTVKIAGSARSRTRRAAGVL